jgi:hypothetical protein
MFAQLFLNRNQYQNYIKFLRNIPIINKIIMFTLNYFSNFNYLNQIWVAMTQKT